MKKKARAASKKPVSNEDLLRAVVHLTEHMVTKEEVADIRLRMSTIKHIEAIKSDMDILGEDIDTLVGEIRYMRGEAVTRDELRSVVDGAKEDILEELRPIARAQDKDTETLLAQDKRITRIEKQLAIK